jgi:sulfofructose kinase
LGKVLEERAGSMSKVLSVGIATVDNIVLVERYPEKDERVVALENAHSVGGPATVAAIAMARLGVAVSLSAVVGRDEAGDFIINTLLREGVDTSLIERSEKPTSTSTIVISASESTRAIMVKPERVAPEKKPINLHDFAWIHADHFGALTLKNWGVKRGGLKGDSTKLSLDLGYATEGISSADWDLYVPSEKITTDISTASRDKNLVVISHGGEGSAYSDGEVQGRVPAISTQVKSTLGAGDVFHGALVATQVWGKALAESVLIANIVAGLSCRALDGYSAIPTRKELDEYLESNSGSLLRERVGI